MSDRLPHWRSTIAQALVLCTLAGCGKTPTQVVVVVTVDDQLQEDVDRVEIEIIDSEGNVVPLDTRTIRLNEQEPKRDIRPHEDPIRLPVNPAGRAKHASYKVRIELWDDREPEQIPVLLGEQTIKGDYIKHELREVWMHFDAACELVRCPENGEYRCQDAQAGQDGPSNPQCVEYCVAPTREGEVTRSTPVPCDAPCETDGCVNDRIVECESDYRVLKLDCGFGCEEMKTSCNQVLPSNMDGEQIPQGRMELIVGSNEEFPHAVFDTDRGSVELRKERDGRFLVDRLCGGPCEEDDGECPPRCDEGLGIVFQMVEAGAPGCDGVTPLEYGVFSLGRLHVLEGATVSAIVNRSRPLILLVNDDVLVDGQISASAVEINRGTGGCMRGEGVGGGKSGNTWSGGGGGSYGGLGGEGGNPVEGVSDAGTLYGNERLVPLVGGSPGGDIDPGGPSGGAIQISTNGRIRIGPRGEIVASGGGGRAGLDFASARARGGGGGGSGGALLLEAGELLCRDRSTQTPNTPRIGVPGGGGGSKDADGEPGDLASLPPGASGGDTAGGRGSGVDDGNALPGETIDNVDVGGGGGGAGRVRINTKTEMTDSSYEAECGRLLHPTSFGTAISSTEAP